MFSHFFTANSLPFPENQTIPSHVSCERYTVLVRCEVCRTCFSRDAISRHRQTCGAGGTLNDSRTTWVDLAGSPSFSSSSSSSSSLTRLERSRYSSDLNSQGNPRVVPQPPNSLDHSYALNNLPSLPSYTLSNPEDPIVSRSSVAERLRVSRLPISPQYDNYDNHQCYICGISITPREEEDHYYAHRLQVLDDYDDPRVDVPQNDTFRESTLVYTTTSYPQHEGQEQHLSPPPEYTIRVIHNPNWTPNRSASHDDQETPELEERLHPTRTVHRSPGSVNHSSTSRTVRKNTERVNRLPCFTFGEFTSGASSTEGHLVPESQCCAICLESYQEAHVLRRMPCFHMFHAKCIDRWLKRSSPESNQCPFCKTCVY